MALVVDLEYKNTHAIPIHLHRSSTSRSSSRSSAALNAAANAAASNTSRTTNNSTASANNAASAASATSSLSGSGTTNTTAAANTAETSAAATATASGTPSTPSNKPITTVTPQAPRHTRLSTSAQPVSPTSGGVSTVEDLATAIQNATGAVAAGTNAATAAASGGAANDKNLLTELQSYLSGLQTTDGTAESPIVVGGRDVDLAAALSADAVGQLIGADGEDGARATASLVPHLPVIETSDSAKKQLKDTVASPQFRQALSTFSSALQSGQLGPVVSQFQLDGDAVAAANSGDLEQFVKALEKKKPSEGVAAKNADQQPMEEDKPNDA